MSKLLITVLLFISFNSISQNIVTYSSQHNKYCDSDTIDTYRTSFYRIMSDTMIVFSMPTESLRRPLKHIAYSIKKIKTKKNKVIYKSKTNGVKFVYKPEENVFLFKTTSSLGTWYNYAISSNLIKM